MDVVEPPPIPGRNAPVDFTGANATFRRLVVRGALLEFVTFGFYRFWLTTDMRRYLWVNTQIDGDSLEYTGRGKELLFGFLVALAVLVPVFLLYFLAGIAVERYKAFASLPLYAFLFVFGQFAQYRARRYRLTRTVWRGVRFWMTGSGWVYAGRSIVWTALTIVTLGFAYPWQMAALERYKFRHTFYGNLPARFDGSGSALFKRVWWVWLLGGFPIAVIIGGAIAAAMAKDMGVPQNAPWMVALGLLMGVAVLGSPGLPFLHAARRAMEWRWWLEGIRFGEATVRCNLPASGLIGIYWAMIGLSIAAILVFALLGGAIVAAIFLVVKPTASYASIMAHLPVSALIGYGVWYISLILTLGVLGRIFLLQRIWKRVSKVCTLCNANALADVGAAGEMAGALGEGLADGLDFAGF